MVTGEAGELREISEALRFRPNGYFFNDSYTRYRLTGGKEGWDGYSYPFKVSGTAGKCLRGHRDEIIILAESLGFKLNKSKLLGRPFADLQLVDVPPNLITATFELDELQRRTIQQWLVHGIGIAHVTVGGGKTASFAGAAQMIKGKFPDARIVYITQSERLVRQAYKDLCGFLPDFRITQFGGGVRDETGKDMVVCTTAMLTRHFGRLYRAKWFSTFIAIFYDEIQHAPSASSMQVLESIPAYFRFGATDSLKEADEAKHCTMIGLFGAIRNVVETHQYLGERKNGDKARLAAPHIYLIDIKEWRDKFRDIGPQAAPNTPAFALLDGVWRKGTYLSPVYEKDAKGKLLIKKRRTLDEDKQWITVEEPITVPGLHYLEFKAAELDPEDTNLESPPVQMEVESRWCLLNRTYDRAITRFKERNQMIVSWTKHFSDQQFPTLVVCTRTLHIYVLESLIKRVVNPDLVRILFSRDSSGQRDETFEWFKTTPGAVLITPLIKEGVSINEIRAGVIADYVADYDVAKQIIGRFLRPKKTGVNRAEIAWFVDNQVETYRRGCNSLFRKLEAVRGFTFYWPCSTPESVQPELSYEGKSIPDLVGSSIVS